MGKKSSTQGDVRSSGQGHKTFLTWGEGDAQLSRAVRMWPAYARTPLRPSIPAGWPFISTHFRYVFGLFCNLFLGMTKPPQRTCASRQRADTRFSPLSWTHPIRAETGFLPFWGGGCGACRTASIHPEGLAGQGISLNFSASSISYTIVTSPIDWTCSSRSPSAIFPINVPLKSPELHRHKALGVSAVRQ